jgi:hypothetical protein
MVAISAPRCPHCGDVRGLREQITKPRKHALKILFGLVGAVIIGGFIVAAIEDYETSAGFEIGKTYAIAKDGYICPTVDALVTAENIGAYSQDRAGSVGCLYIVRGMDSVLVLEKNSALVKVRYLVQRDEKGQILGEPDVFTEHDQFEGWTEAENIKPAN